MQNAHSKALTLIGIVIAAFSAGITFGTAIARENRFFATHRHEPDFRG